ncbi:MAG: hydrogenase iron-sulfur subunit [Sedimentisphaerales bacterium]
MNKQASKMYVFYCSNGITVKTIGLPCSGKVDIPYLVKAFETGADGVVIVTCKQNECRYLEGDVRAQKRAEAVESLLEEIGMGKGRMAVINLKEDDPEQILGEIKDFFDKVRNLPQSRHRSITFNG